MHVSMYSFGMEVLVVESDVQHNCEVHIVVVSEYVNIPSASGMSTWLPTGSRQHDLLQVPQATSGVPWRVLLNS